MAAAYKEAFAAVKELMQTSNKPQNVQTAINNTGSKYGKTTVQKALDELVAQNLCIYTEIGKTGKLYLWNQNLLEVLSDAQLMEVNAQINDLKAQVEKLTQQGETLRITQRNLEAAPITEVLKQEVDELHQQVSANDEKLRLVRESNAIVSDADMLTLQKNYKDAMTAWATRRAKCREVIDTLSEGMGVKPSAFMDQLGLEEGLPMTTYTEMKKTLPPVNVSKADIKAALKK